MSNLLYQMQDTKNQIDKLKGDLNALDNHRKNLSFGTRLAEWWVGSPDGETLEDVMAIADDLDAAEKKLAALNAQIATVITLFRGTRLIVENQIYNQTGIIMSESAQEAYMQSGSVDDALAASRAQTAASSEFWGSLDNYVQAHGEFGVSEMSDIAPRSLISWTQSLSTAQMFAGENGTVYTIAVDSDVALAQTLATSTELEYVIQDMAFGAEVAAIEDILLLEE